MYDYPSAIQHFLSVFELEQQAKLSDDDDDDVRLSGIVNPYSTSVLLC